jgi:2-polyprenyl-6-methoxyphenol hydroxylase-like FAD-dependent oxidoreductase
MKNAIIIGGSIGGLLMGVVLAEVCERVVLVERGELPDTPLPRAGVPQGLHAHGLLAGGLVALEQLLPGLCRELEQSGCPTGDNLRDAAWVFSGRRLSVARLERSEGLVSCNVLLGCPWQRLNLRGRRRDVLTS